MDVQFYEIFEEWCHEQGVKCEKNKKLFYVDDKNNLVKPDYLLNGVVYIKIVDNITKITKHRKLFQNFKVRYGPILVIASHVISDVRYGLTIRDLEENFNLKIK